MAIAEQDLEACNGDDPSFFWQSSTQSALRALGQAALTDMNGNLVSTSLSQSASGRKLLFYVLRCALPAGVTVTSADASYQGSGGIAPAWASSPLGGVASQRWMTACLLQTLNGLDAHVPIRMSGNLPALFDAPGEDISSYTVGDATMFGNIFLPGGGPAYACTDVGLINACGVQASTYTLQRICGLSHTCGITLLGPCSLRCTAGLSGPTCHDPGGNSYPESIATTLQKTASIQIYPLCAF